MFAAQPLTNNESPWSSASRSRTLSSRHTQSRPGSTGDPAAAVASRTSTHSEYSAQSRSTAGWPRSRSSSTSDDLPVPETPVRSIRCTTTEATVVDVTVETQRAGVSSRAC